MVVVTRNIQGCVRAINNGALLLMAFAANSSEELFRPLCTRPPSAMTQPNGVGEQKLKFASSLPG